uniref:Uncharacterized protein n=1 Tax=Anguilla anguilla TaxID=7936 RepID=A0A0E9Q2R3_ANGAN
MSSQELWRAQLFSVCVCAGDSLRALPAHYHRALHHSNGTHIKRSRLITARAAIRCLERII